VVEDWLIESPGGTGDNERPDGRREVDGGGTSSTPASGCTAMGRVAAVGVGTPRGRRRTRYGLTSTVRAGRAGRVGGSAPVFGSAVKLPGVSAVPVAGSGGKVEVGVGLVPEFRKAPTGAASFGPSSASWSTARPTPNRSVCRGRSRRGPVWRTGGVAALLPITYGAAVVSGVEGATPPPCSPLPG